MKGGKVAWLNSRYTSAIGFSKAVLSHLNCACAQSFDIKYDIKRGNCFKALSTAIYKLSHLVVICLTSDL